MPKSESINLKNTKKSSMLNGKLFMKNSMPVSIVEPIWFFLSFQLEILQLNILPIEIFSALVELDQKTWTDL